MEKHKKSPQSLSQRVNIIKLLPYFPIMTPFDKPHSWPTERCFSDPTAPEIQREPSKNDKRRDARHGSVGVHETCVVDPRVRIE